ncbi:MAG TPA: hypothetical protein DHW39_01315, partial [Erysipelotrichaceae bacterium]|nr:hypothetical protein [Erysipelotrichaceae bacterium]
MVSACFLPHDTSRQTSRKQIIVSRPNRLYYLILKSPSVKDTREGFLLPDFFKSGAQKHPCKLECVDFTVQE